MKIFNTIEELWQYCSYCPICKDNDRRIILEVGPDDVFFLKDFSKTNNILKLKCKFISSTYRSYLTIWEIDCNTNSISVNISEIEEDNEAVNKASSSNFYFYISAKHSSGFCR